MKIAVLYICTGKYNLFFPDFYSSSEKFFLNGIASLEYFVFTDDMSLTKAYNVHLIRKECKGFPADSLFRFDMFLSIKKELEKFDYIYFFNSNALFLESVGEEIIPDKTGLVSAEWPGIRKPFKNPIFYPYERNKKSLAYIPPFDGPYMYYMGGINGGQSNKYLDMIECLAKNIREDYKKGIVACGHDESHINAYFHKNKSKVLGPEYCMPEEWINGIIPKIIFRDKVKIDKYFDKGRDYSTLGKIKKSISIFYRVLSWFI